jgi:hypothetical protein
MLANLSPVNCLHLKSREAKNIDYWKAFFSQGLAFFLNKYLNYWCPFQQQKTKLEKILRLIKSARSISFKTFSRPFYSWNRENIAKTL